MAETRAPRTIILAGDPTGMGARHGRLLCGEIRFLVAQMHHHIFRRVGHLKGTAVRVLAHSLAMAMNHHIPPHLRQEMRAIALESGVGYSNVLLLNTLDDVLNILRRLAPRAPSTGCSSFALLGDRSHDGTLIHGRNLDYHFRGTPLDDGGMVSKLLLQHATVFVCRPRDRASFVSIGWPGLSGTTTAMNQWGISLGNLTSYIRGTTPIGTPSSILYRMIAEEARTLPEVRQLLQGARRTIGNNLMVGSGRENSAALFEITRDSLLEVPPQDGTLVATNHFASPELSRRQREFLLPHSVARWNRLRMLCDRRGLAPNDALAMLADVDSTAEGGKGSPFARVANEGTAVSVLFRPTEMRLWMGISAGPPASLGEFRPIDVGKLLASPSDG